MTGTLAKPSRLKEGDTVAAVSPSWGGPHAFPVPYELGVRNLQDIFGVRVIEYPTTRANQDYLHGNPQARAEDLNRAFADPQVSAIFSTIGGEDSVRVLPYIDVDTIRRNPKIFMGFSDTTTLLTYLNQLGIVTYYGTSVMTGFASLKHLPAQFTQHLRQMLVEPAPTYTYLPYEEWVQDFQRWEAPDYDARTTLAPNVEGWQWLQGDGIAQGRLFGGCLDVLEMVKATRFWPEPDFWKGKILFLETSEDKPTPSQVRFALRNYGMQGVFDRISALLYARPYGYTPSEKDELYQNIVKVVAVEFGRPDLPIVANMDFGHDLPIIVMPLGVMAEVNCQSKTVRVLESSVA